MSIDSRYDFCIIIGGNRFNDNNNNNRFAYNNRNNNEFERQPREINQEGGFNRAPQRQQFDGGRFDRFSQRSERPRSQPPRKFEDDD